MKIKKLVTVIAFGFACLAAFSQEAVKTEKILLQNDNIRVEYVDFNGGVFLHSIEGKNKTPVIDTVDYAGSSFIGLGIDRHYYNLRNSGKVKFAGAKIEDKIEVIYTIDGKVILTVDYSIQGEDVLNIKYSIQNIDSQVHNISFKTIFDLILGEWQGGLYATDIKTKINSETIISDFRKHKYVLASDGVTGVKFILNDDFAKNAYKVVVAGKPYFENDAFEGRFQEGRSFNTVLSYNNSGIGFFYKSVVLEPEQEKIYSQNILFLKSNLTAAGKNKPSEFQLSKEASEIEEKFYQKTYADSCENEKTECDSNKNEKDEALNEEVSEGEVKEDESKETSEEEVKSEVQEKNSSLKRLSDEDRAYALKLIEKINQLQESGENTSRSEVMRLQTELNLILKKLID